MVEQIREAIRCARIAPGTRLPSSRRLSEQLAISRNTVVRAYDLLLMEGDVEARPASGIYVAEQRPCGGRRAAAAGDRDAAAAADADAAAAARARSLAAPHRNRLLVRFLSRPARSADLFPLKTWRRLLQAIFRMAAARASPIRRSGRLPALRTAIASHLAASRGIVADPSRIIIVSGIQEGLRSRRGCFSTAVRSARRGSLLSGRALRFEAAGAEVVSVAVDQDGLIADGLPQRTTRCSISRRRINIRPAHAVGGAARDIIAWARRYGCYLLEDDYDCDYPLRRVASQADRGAGAGLHDLSRDLLQVARRRACGSATWSCRRGSPKRVRTRNRLLNSGNSWLEQAALADMMRSGSYARICCASARTTGTTAISDRGAAAQFRRGRCRRRNGGLHVLWHLPPGVPDARPSKRWRSAPGSASTLSPRRASLSAQTALAARVMILVTPR